MKFILLTIFLCIAGNTYAVINDESYIYSNESDEISLYKEQLKTAKDRTAEARINLFQNHRKVALSSFDKSEVVYRVGDITKKDIGAKIGMSKDQVLNKSYWGKPDKINTALDESGKIELWTYEIHGERKITTKTTAFLFFIDGKLTHIVR